MAETLKYFGMIILIPVLIAGCECNRIKTQYQAVCSDGFETQWVDKLNLSKIPEIKDGHVIYYKNNHMEFYKIPDDVICDIANRQIKVKRENKTYPKDF